MEAVSKDTVSNSEQFKNKLQTRTARVGIIGLGYVGLPLALLFNEQRFPVTGFDIDVRKVDTLNAGGSSRSATIPKATEVAAAAPTDHQPVAKRARSDSRTSRTPDTPPAYSGLD